MAPQKLKIAAAGLGRMGRRHALNFLNRAPRAELVAAFSPDPDEISWARINLEPYGVTLYDNYDKMIEHEGLMAVVIGTATSVHAEEAIKAMEKNLHVLVEKPLSTDIEIVRFATPSIPSKSFGSSIANLFPFSSVVQASRRRSSQEAPFEGHVWLLPSF